MGGNLITQRQRREAQLQIVERPLEAVDPIRLLRSIAPGAVSQLGDLHRGRPKIAAVAVLVEPAKPMHGLLDFHQQPFGLFHDGRSYEGHVRARLPRADY
jgi:hypothetical protein